MTLSDHHQERDASNTGQAGSTDDGSRTPTELPTTVSTFQTLQPQHGGNPSKKKPSKCRGKTKHFLDISSLVVVTAYTIIAGLQWWQILSANRLTREALLGNSNALTQTITTMKGQILATNNLYAEAQRQTGQIKTLAENSGTQATAAADSAATAAQALAVSADQSHSDQRAWIGVAETKTLSYATDPTTRTVTFTVAFTLRNYGRSAADRVHFFAGLEPNPLANGTACKAVSKDRRGDILLPTQTRTVNWVMKLTRKQMEAAWQHQNSESRNMLLLRVSGCVGYSDKAREQPHLTPFDYLVLRANSYISGDTKEIPAEELSLAPYWSDANQIR